MDPLPARQRVLPAVPHDVDWHDDAGAGLTVTQGASPYEQLRRVRNFLTRACAWLRFRRDAARDLPPGRAERRRCPPLLGNAHRPPAALTPHGVPMTANGADAADGVRRSNGAGNGFDHEHTGLTVPNRLPVS